MSWPPFLGKQGKTSQVTTNLQPHLINKTNKNQQDWPSREGKKINSRQREYHIIIVTRFNIIIPFANTVALTFLPFARPYLELQRLALGNFLLDTFTHFIARVGSGIVLVYIYCLRVPYSFLCGHRQFWKFSPRWWPRQVSITALSKLADSCLVIVGKFLPLVQTEMCITFGAGGLFGVFRHIYIFAQESIFLNCDQKL